MLRKLKKYLAAPQLVVKFHLMHVAMAARLKRLVSAVEAVLVVLAGKIKKTSGKMTLTGFTTSWKIS